MIPILCEDDSYLVIDKPAGLVVNNSSTTKNETVETWSRSYLKLPSVSLDEKSAELPLPDGSFDYEAMFLQRAGIVHRLDKETSGILVIAKNSQSFKILQTQFKQRETNKTYLALVHGALASNGDVNAPTGRLPWNRTQFGVVPGGREAKTTYTIIDRYVLEGEKQIQEYTYVQVHPLTGRTHQIRVHMKHINHPVVGDSLYSGRKNYMFVKKYLSRMFLHAHELTFFHPVSGREVTVTSSLPRELQAFLDTCRKIK